MAESYFELLTEQQGLPAKQFDPLGELKRLRRTLALRVQDAERTEKADLPSLQVETETTIPSIPESPSLEAVVKQVGEMKTALTIWQRSRVHTRVPHGGVFRGQRRFWNRRRIPSAIIQYLNTPQGEMLETTLAGLMALGFVGVVFGVLSFCRGLESDLSLGALVCASGMTIVAIGLVGHFLASQSESLS